MDQSYVIKWAIDAHNYTFIAIRHNNTCKTMVFLFFANENII